MSDINKCATEGDLAELQRIIAEGVSFDARDSRNWTPIIHASFNGHLPVVEFLISVNADLNVQDNDGCTALHWATCFGHLSIVKALLTAGVDTSPKNILGNSAEASAVFNNKLECAQAIREHIERGDDLGPKAAHFTGSE